MKHKGILLVLSGLLSAGIPASAQLIQNGGFETGDFTGWSEAGTAHVQLGSAGSNFVHSGTHGASLGSGTLSQSFATTPGQIYRVDFLLNAIAGGGVGLLEITWQNFDTSANLDLGTLRLIHSFEGPPLVDDNGWYKYSYDVLALGDESSLKFEFQTQAVTYPDNVALDGVKVQNTPDFVAVPPLDGVPIGDPSPDLPFAQPYVLDSSVTFTPVPEPSTYGAFAALALAGLALKRRFFAATRRT